MKKTTLFVLLCFSFSIHAGEIVGGTSPTKEVTSVFSEPIDQYLDTVDFNLLDSSVLFLQFDMPEKDVATAFELGTGKRFNENLYLGGNLSLNGIGSEQIVDETLLIGSSIYADSAENPTGRIDIIESNNSNTSEFAAMANILAGLKLGVFTIGINGNFYMADTINGNDTKTGFINTGITAIDSLTNSELIGDDISISNLDPTKPTKYTRTYDIDGNKLSEEGDVYSPDGYKNNKVLSLGLNAGLQLKLSTFILDIKGGFYLDNYDKSLFAQYTNYKTNYDSELPTFSGIQGTYNYKDYMSEVVDISNLLIIFGSISTDYKISDNFVLESGLTYAPSFNIYTDGGISQKFNSTVYTATVVGAFVETATTANSYNKINDISDITHYLSIPLTVKSTFNNKFNFIINNTLGLYTNSIEDASSAVNVKTVTTHNTDSLINDTIVTTTSIFRDVTTKTDTTNLMNNTNIGAQFYLTNKIRINLGSTLNMTPYSSTTKSVTNSGDGKIIEMTTKDGITYESAAASVFNDPNMDDGSGLTEGNPEVETIIGLSSSQITYKAGFTYFFSTEMFLDLIMDGNAGNGGNIWDTTSWSLLMTIKY